MRKLIKNNFNLEFDFDSFKNRTYSTHNFHPYPAKFAPQIPRDIVLALSKENDVVLDPFCGSGTTLVESLINKRNAIGVDSNPIAALMTKVKTTILSTEEINECKKKISKINLNIINEKNSILNFFNIDYWFEYHVQNELASIIHFINKITNKNIRDFLLVAVSAIITNVSNQDSDTRYVRRIKNLKPGDTIKKFRYKSQNMCERIEKLQQISQTNIKIYNKDAKNLEFIKSKTIDLIITSPPYMNTYDYYLYHRNRMNWLQMDSKIVQKLEIGSRNKHSDENNTVLDYLELMTICIMEMKRVLRTDKFLCIIIGDAIKNGEYIKMDICYEKILKKNGLTLKYKYSFNQRKYTTAFTKGLKNKHKFGHILIFKNNI